MSGWPGPAPADYPSDFYAAVHRGNAGDVDFYLQACAGLSPVLELGCGEGRIGAALAAAGLEVWGIDVRPDAVAVARASGLAAHVGDMTDFALPRVFRRVLIPYNGLLCLTSASAQQACLSAARRHLAVDGELILDAYSAASGPVDCSSDDEWNSLGTIDCRGRTWDVSEASSNGPEAQQVLARYRHVARGSGDIVEARIAQRFIEPGEWWALVADAGLEIVRMHGGFNDESFDEESPMLVLHARASGGAE